MSEADFLARQRWDAADAGSDYTDAQYNSLRDAALRGFSRQVPRDTTSSITTTTTGRSYALPADFITVETSALDPYDDLPTYRITTDTGGVLEPVEDFVVVEPNLLLAAAPGVVATWTLSYGGAWSVATLLDRYIQIVLDLAASLVYERKMAESAPYFDYRNGVLTVDKSAVSAHWQELRDAKRAAYDAAVAPLTSTSTTVGSFSYERA